ncbi:macrolide ABC transporter permease/ATPase [Gammaproteobacteria bacterium]|nr:macrolide ABC transporter permease/ATPase [Gammaproteobacteria bacterium]
MNIISLKNISRTFKTSLPKNSKESAPSPQVTVLQGITLEIAQGEMLAIMGTSGSGKSTLMNILGCLDTASSGDYLFHGKNIAKFDADELAQLRREHFGFIFQRYHLLNTLSARKNVEIPAMYAGMPAKVRALKAGEILSSLGLDDRIDYNPNQLSGGQQQRVSIARALINGGEVILADEPTGALDSVSGASVLENLKALNKAGHTIIMVTHDRNVASHARRIIELKDGEIIADYLNDQKTNNQDHNNLENSSEPVLSNIQTQSLTQSESESKSQIKTKIPKSYSKFSGVQRIADAFKMALVSMIMQKMRTFLTMLGIIIGIASVVIIVAIGNGTTDKILNDISGLGTSTLEVYPGSGFGDRNSGRVRSLKPSDAQYLKEQPYIHSVTPTVSSNKMIRYGNIAVNAVISGVGADFFEVRDYKITEGVGFNRQSEDDLALEAVIDQNTRDKLFAKTDNPLGEVILLGNLPVRIIGVSAPKAAGFGSSASLEVWIPYSSAMKRMLGQSFLRNITLRINDDVDLALAENNITEILTRLHGKKDFFIINTDAIRDTIKETTGTLTLLVASIAVISLIVGGIGVMNIMLVSVSERTREIGMRMAVGARKSDISQQFIIEAVLVCLVGGLIGIAFALILGFGLNWLITSFQLRFSWITIVLAFTCSSFIGLTFGYFPAKRAANLAPIEALERS